MKKIIVALTALFSILTISCEIGLGSSVDTDPPALNILNPPVDAIIRDDFSIGGTWSDDGTIESIAVELSRTDGNGQSLKYTGVFNEDPKKRGSGNWYSEIPAVTAPVTDGTYQAVVTIKDTSGRTTTQSTTFTIDNTPPVIVLQRPGTDLNASLSDADTYGQVFSLEGLGADDSNIDHIDVLVYGDKNKTDLKTTITLSNVPPSISLDVAKYGEAAYTAIYGNVDPNDFRPAQFYCTIRAYDSAARYPLNAEDKSEDDSLGNSTDVYYIYEDISNNVLNNTKITEIYKIMSGAASYSASDSAAIISNLSANEKTTGSFVLDPKNNPTFSIVGKPSLLTGANAECLQEESDYTVSNGSDITILAAIGLDNSPIVNDDTFKVYFQEAEFVNGKYTGKGRKIYPVIDPVNGKKKVGSNYQFAVNIQSSEYNASVPGSGLVVSRPYIIGVEGKDENNKTFLAANNGYGFYLVSLSSAPTLKDITPADTTIYIKAGQELRFTGKTKLTEGNPVVTIRYDDNDWCTTGPLTQLVAGKTDEYEFDITVPASKFSTAANDQCKEFQIEIRSSNGGKSSSTYKTVMYDINEPVISELSITPEIKDANDNSVYLLNGTIAVKAMLEDQFTAIKKWHYEIWQDGSAKKTGTEQTTSKVEFTYDTKALAGGLTDERDAIIKIIAEDKAGNLLTKNISCYVDQKTDRPSFEAQDGKLWKSDVKNPHYINSHLSDTDALKTNVITGNLYAKVTDDDSVAYVRFEVEPVKLKDGLTDAQKADKTFEGYESDTSSRRAITDADIRSKLYSKEGKETSVTHKMPTTPGFYLVTQTVYDKNFVSAGTSPAKTDENTANQFYYAKSSYVIKVSGTGPQYTLTPSTSYISRQKTDKQLSVTINIEGGEGPYTIKRNNVELTQTSLTNYVDTFTVADILTAQNGTDTNVTVEYLIIDANGDTSKILTFSNDETPPSFANLKIDPESDDYSVYKHRISSTQDEFYLNNKKQTFTISGLASDTVGVEKVCLKIENTGGTGTTIEKEANTGYFTGIKFADFDSTGAVTSYWSGAAKVTVKVYDTAGNTSTPVSLDILFDCEVPEIGHDIDDSQKNLRFRIGNYKNDAGDLDVGGKYSNGSYGSATSIMIRGYFPDNEGGSGISKYYYWVSRKEVKIDASKTDGADYKVGTGSDADKIFFKNEAVLTSYVVQNNTDTFSPLTTNETKRVEYNINDAHKAAEKAKYADGQPNTEHIEIVDDVNKKKGYWQFRKDVVSNFKTTIKGFEEGSNYLVIVAEDNVGNVRLDSATVSGVPYPCYSLNVDVNAPSITEKTTGDFSKVILANGAAPVNFEFYVLESTSQIKDDAFIVKLGSNNLTLTPKSSLTTETDDEKKLLNIVEVGVKNAENKYQVKLQIGTSAFTGLSGNQAVQVVAEDEAHNASSATIVGNLNVDTTGPSIQITSDSSINKYIKDSISAVIYVNDVNGIAEATDTTGGKVYYNIREKNAASNVLTSNKSVDINKDNGTATISINNTEITTNASKEYELVITAADKAGNTTTHISDAYKVDKKAPEFVNLKLKNIASTAFAGTYFGETTLALTGSFKDENGSGVKLIHYKLNSGEEKTITPTLNADGINYDYSANVGVFNENENTFVIWAEDKTGNVGAADTERKTFTVKIDTTAPEISEKTTGDFDKSYLTNGTKPIELEFNVGEAASGINQDADAFTVKLGADTITLSSNSVLAEKTAEQKKALNYVEVGNKTAENKYPVTLHIGTTDLTSLNGNKTIKVSVKDRKENDSGITVVGSVNKDGTAPEPSFTYPKYGTTAGVPDSTKIPDVNKTITIEGKIKEANAIDAITLTATPPASSSKTSKTFTYKRELGEGETNTLTFDVDTKEWSVDVNTYEADWNNTDNIEKWTLSISATDEAGNTGTGNQEMNIDQDSDRPVIKFTNLPLNTMTQAVPLPFESRSLYGSVTDDDGVLELHYQSAASTTALAADGWTELPLSNGGFTLDFATDGSKNLYFKVKDFAGTEFISSETDSYSISTPKLTDSAATPNKYGYKDSATGKKQTVTYVKVDTTAPFLGSLQFSVNYDAASPTWESKSEISSSSFGGTRNKLKIRVPAWDANGIDPAQATITIPGYSGTITLTDSGVNAGNATYSDAHYWISGEIGVSGLESGIKSCEISVSDGVKESKDEFSISVDNTPPTVSLKAPDSNQYSSGSVIAYGETDLTDWKNIADTDRPKEFMYYALSLDNTTEPAQDKQHQSSASAITSWKNENDVTATASNAPGGNPTISYKPYYISILGSSGFWYVYFDGKTATETTHDDTLKSFLINSGITTQEKIETTVLTDKFTTVVKAYLWIKAVDEVGLETVEKYPILIDPQGDAPTVTIDYPEKSGTTLGGDITLRGTAADTIGTEIGVDSVWVQIISAINNGYDSEAVTATTDKTCGGLKFKDTVTPTTANNQTTYAHTYTLKEFKPTLKDVRQWIAKEYDVYINITTNPQKITSVSGADSADGSAYYIKASFSGSAWNLKINDKGEFNPTEGKLNPIAYRVFAKDKDKNLSRYQEQLSIFDSDNPVVSGLYLRQYENNENGSGTVLASRAFEDDMWVKGGWWLCGTVTDTQGLSALKIGPAASKENQTITGTANTAENFKYKLETDIEGKAGSLSIVIEASDKASPVHTTKKVCVINYDNKDPELVVTGNGFNIPATMQNDNGFYSFGSQVTENTVDGKDQSGFAYLAFWFERTLTDKHYVYDVMRAKENSEVNYSGLTSDSGLMWKSKSVGRSQTSLGTLTLGDKDSNIHVGGLCKIGGAIYFISSVSADGKTIGIDGQPEYETASETALFAIANVVNNNVESGSGEKSTDDGTYGYFTDISNDDYDHMVESVKKSGSTWTWEANINSRNIKDGAVKLHYVAFDKAGNYKAGEVSGNVANNAPRIASLKVWSDFNENNSEDPGESDTKYWMGKERKVGGVHTTRATAVTSELVVSGNNNDYDSSGSAFMTVKANTRLTPELVGGNGALFYSYRYKKNSNAEWTSQAYGAATIGNGSDDGIDEEIDATGYYRKDENDTGYILGNTAVHMDIPGTVENETTGTYSMNMIGNSTSTANPTWFEYTIYDSTEGCASWTSPAAGTSRTDGRLIAKFRVALNLQYQDSEAPVVKIRPFYWNSKTDNSVSWTSGANPVAEGHIELESDITDAISSLTNGTKALGSDDPKVSGKIKVEGYAFDDIKLKELYVQMEGHTNIGSAQLASTYSGSWTTRAYSNGWGFTAEDVYCNASGHLVHWTLTVDTAVRTNPAELDKAVVVYAVDARGAHESTHDVTAQTKQTTSSSSYTWSNVKDEEDALTTYFTDIYGLTSVTDETAADTTVYKNTMTYYYKMDIVPYITKLYTSLSDSAGDEFARSATGKYIVRENETVKLYGFNLKAGTNAGKIGSSNVTPTTGATDSRGTYVNFPIGANSSGAVSITVNSVPCLNNINADPVFTSVTNDTITAVEYNSQADGVSNNRLTDDVELWVWTTSAFDNKMNTTNITSPMMKMDNSGNYYISYGNGAITYSIDKNGSSTDLEICYNKYHNTNVAFDSSGNFYGVGTNTDRAGDTINTQSSFTFFSRSVGKALYDNNNIDANESFTSNGASRAHYTAGSNKRRLELSQYGTGAYNINRVQRPKLTVSGSGDSAKVYMAYYDASADNVKFRYGVVSGTETLTYSNWTGNYSRNSKMTLGLANDLTGNGTDTSSADGYHLLADSADSTKFKAGAYTAVGYTSDGKAVVAWYDAKARRLVYSYNNTPGTNETSMTSNTWQTNAVYLDGSYTGWYVDLVVDAGNHVHIAYYNSKSGDLKYVYIPTYNGVTKDANGNLTGGATVVTVDSYLSVGTNITINVRDEGTGTGNAHEAKYVPYIYYYNTSNNQTMNSVKVAWQNETTLRDGAINDKFTGAWESMTIPTQNIPVDATVCGGVPSTATGNDAYKNNTVILGYMTDVYYEKAYIKGNIK